jgi:hypothetical protein
MRPGFINSFQPARDPPPPGLSIYDYFHSGSASGLTVSRFSRGTNASSSQIGNVSPGAAEASATPFFVGSTGCRVDTLGVEAVGVSSFLTVSVEVGIYDNAPFGAGSIYPRNRLASGQIDYVTSSEVGLKRTAIGLDLTEGLYWLAFVVISPVNPRSWTAPTPDDRHPEVPFMGTVGQDSAFSYYVGGPTLPATYPSGALVANNATQSKRAPSFFLELS